MNWAIFLPQILATLPVWSVAGFMMHMLIKRMNKWTDSIDRRFDLIERHLQKMELENAKHIPSMKQQMDFLAEVQRLHELDIKELWRHSKLRPTTREN